MAASSFRPATMPSSFRFPDREPGVTSPRDALAPLIRADNDVKAMSRRGGVEVPILGPVPLPIPIAGRAFAAKQLTRVGNLDQHGPVQRIAKLEASAVDPCQSAL